MTAFDRALAFMLRWEGGDKYHCVAGDPGGATKYGVSLRFLQSLSLRDADLTSDGVVDWRDVQSLDHASAESIYRAYFWDKLRCDSLPADIAVPLFDSAVNCGRSRSARWLQELVGVARDGQVGPQTIAAVWDSWEREGPELTGRLLDRRERYYRELAEAEWAKKFVKGWLNRTRDLRRYLRMQ